VGGPSSLVPTRRILFLAGRKRQSPAILQHFGLEWLFRLLNEPRRLWRRYLYRNPRFVHLFTAQLVRRRSAGSSLRLRDSGTDGSSSSPPCSRS
jgi:hypothetical protein